MPADASGVTTDDQGPRPDAGGDSASSNPEGGRSESSSTAPGSAPATDRDTDGAPVSGNGGASASSRPDPAPPPAAGYPTTAAPGAQIAPPGETPETPAESPGDPTPELGSAAALAGGEPPPAPVLVPPGRGEPPPAPVLVPPGRGEPPPAPVLVPPGRWWRRGHGRHASTRADRASRRGLRVNQRLWSLNLWSVFKISVLFYFCLGLIILVAGTLLYNAGRRVGTIDQVESFVTRMGAYGECIPQAEVPEGAEFEADDDKCAEGEVLVGGFTLDDGTLFRAAAIGGTILVVAGSIGNVLLTVLLNLLNELTGGLRHTVIKEPVARPAGSGSARSPGGRVRVRGGPGGGSPGGSPRPRPRG
jgi:hypothetical protein